MKNLFFALMLLSTACYHSKPTADDYRGNASGLISFHVWNNSLVPHKYTLIGYNPGERGNWANGLMLLPGAHHAYSCPVGTKIYCANQKQTDLVMGGGSIYNEPPLITVTSEDQGRSFPLND